MSSPLLISANKDFIRFSSKVLLFVAAVVLVFCGGGGGSGGGGGGDSNATRPFPERKEYIYKVQLVG